MNPTDLTLIQARDAIARGELRSADLVRACLGRIDSADGLLHCFLQVFADRALERAEDVDRQVAKGGAPGARRALLGVPIAVKDNLCLEYGRTTCASRMLEAYESPYTATALTKLIDAGAIILGKTNMDEFAMGSSTENSAFGPTRNPWRPARVPGGSSGGSAAAVAARMVPGALGSDTGGSVRQPAALCGLVGLKPTYGRISRWGLVAYASSLDQVGPIARTTRDIAVLFEVLAGRDPHDSTSADMPAPDMLSELETPVEGLRIAAPRQARSGVNHPEVSACFDRSLAALRSMGATIVDVDLPHLEYGVPAYYIVATAEASSNLARFDGVRYGRRADISRDDSLEELYSRSRAEGFGAEVQRRIMLGTYALSSGYYDAYYLTALKVRRRIKEDVDRALSANGCHAVITPSTVNPAFELGAMADDPLAMYLEDLYTVTANLTGLPAISVPAGLAEVDGARLPIGVQFMGEAFEEPLLLRIARMFEAEVWPAGNPAPPG